VALDSVFEAPAPKHRLQMQPWQQRCWGKQASRGRIVKGMTPASDGSQNDPIGLLGRTRRYTSRVLRIAPAAALARWSRWCRQAIATSEPFKVEPYFWVPFYRAALFESEPDAMQKKVLLALAAVERRRLAGTCNEQEQSSLLYASLVLRCIQRNGQIRSAVGLKHRAA